MLDLLEKIKRKRNKRRRITVKRFSLDIVVNIYIIYFYPHFLRETYILNSFLSYILIILYRDYNSQPPIVDSGSVLSGYTSMLC